MIIDFHKCYGGGSGSGVTSEQVQEQINSALTPYWDSATTKSAIAEVATGISLVLEGYATSDDMQSAFTLISETQQAAEAGYNQLEARIDELSGSSPDLSAYYTSAQTENAIQEALSGYSPDLSAYYTSAQTESAIEVALAGYSPDLSGYYTSAQTESAIEGAMTAYTPTTGFSTINGSAITDGGDIVIESTSVDLSGYYTSAQTESAIDEAMTAYTPTTGFSTINGSAITNGGDIVIQGGGADMSAYYTSAQTDAAISAATSGKADAANVSAVSSGYHIPIWNDEGVITGETGQLYSKWFSINGINKAGFMSNYDYNFGPIFAPVSVGTAGDILVSTGNGAPVWSAVTFPDVSNYVTSAQVETQITSKGYATVSQIPTVPTSNTAFTNDAGYITSAAIANMVTSTYISSIWKGTQAEYDAITTKDPNTFYIIL